jgi:rare lipoprotein A
LAFLVYGGMVISEPGRTSAPVRVAVRRSAPAAAPAILAPAGMSDRGHRGRASWYGPEFQGSPTASGEPFNMNALTAAHRTLPLGSYARVKNLDNGRSVVVKINDRGPHARRRMIDLSYAAAREIRMVGAGTARVEVEPVTR